MPSQSIIGEPETNIPTMAVSIKIPPFWPDDAEVWLAQIEAQFKARNISNSNTKFYQVVSALTPEVACQVRDVILQPDVQNPYENLRDEILKRLTDTKEQKFQKLLQMDSIGDRKPTQLLRQMQMLLGEHEGDFLKQLFMSKLSSEVQAILTCHQTKSLKDIAEIADSIMLALNKQEPRTHQISEESEINALRNEIEKLKIQRSNSNQICWYHQRFGKNAKKCFKPCQFSGNGVTNHI